MTAIATYTWRRLVDLQIDWRIPQSTTVLKTEAMEFTEPRQIQCIIHVVQCFVLGLEVNYNRVDILCRNPQLLCYLKLKFLQQAYLLCGLLQNGIRLRKVETTSQIKES